MPTSPIQNKPRDRGVEVCQFHTRILRVSLVVEESRAYWQHLHTEIPKNKRAVVAFEERWFGSKSIERVRARWVTQQLKSEWFSATTQRMATGLITSSTAAGLCTDNPGIRRLKYPQVTDEALTYWLYFLRHLCFQGSILDNPYLASVGLSEGELEQRLRRLPGLAFNRMGELHDFGWYYADLKAWGIQALGLKWEET